jgi:hypothetical protein
MEGLTMDEQRFDNIARRLGRIRSRRDALKTAGLGTVAAAFTAFGLEKSALAQVVTIENHCRVRGAPCPDNNKKKCCGYTKKHKKEIVCGPSTEGPGPRCCGQKNASCVDDTDCCLTYRCSVNDLICVPE